MDQHSPAPVIPAIPAGPMDQTADGYTPPTPAIRRIDEDPDF